MRIASVKYFFYAVLRNAPIDFYEFFSKNRELFSLKFRRFFVKRSVKKARKFVKTSGKNIKVSSYGKSCKICKKAVIYKLIRVDKTCRNM